MSNQCSYINIKFIFKLDYFVIKLSYEKFIYVGGTLTPQRSYIMGVFSGVPHCSYCGASLKPRWKGNILGTFVFIWDICTLFCYWWLPHYCSNACKSHHKGGEK
jgi:hypothetical protein